MAIKEKERVVNFRSNPLLKRAGVKYHFTKKQIGEYLKCKEDPIYFIKNYVKIVSLDEGVVLFNLRPYQEKMITTIHENRRVVGRICRQAGKCFHINTPIRLRNKVTGDIIETTIGELYYETKNDIQTN